jgi:hypothetical protein
MNDDQFAEFTRRMESAIESGFEQIALAIATDPDTIPKAIERGFKSIDQSVEFNLSGIRAAIENATTAMARWR